MLRKDFALPKRHGILYSSVSDEVCCVRASVPVKDSRKDDLDKDFNSRKSER